MNKEEAQAAVDEEPYCGFSSETLDSLGVTQCYACGSLVTFDEVGRHQTWHEALSLLLGERSDVL